MRTQVPEKLLAIGEEIDAHDSVIRVICKRGDEEIPLANSRKP
jgi:hypothetical protein